MNIELIGAVGLAVVMAVFLVFRTKKPADPSEKKLSFEAQFDRFLRRKAVSLILLALISNTVLAQLYVRSNGKIIFPGAWSSVYVIAAAIGTTLAFSLFEILQTRTLNELLNDGLHHEWHEWLKNLLATVFASAYNFYSIALLDEALSADWLKHHTAAQLPSWSDVPLGVLFTAAGFTAILFLVSFVGDRKLTPEQEVKRVQDETQRQLLQAVQESLQAVIDGTMPPSKEFVALCTMGSEISKRFFANFVGAMRGEIDMEDVLAMSNISGIIRPRAGKNPVPQPPPVKDDDSDDDVIVAPVGQRPLTNEEKWAKADQLRARIIVEGYPLPDIERSQNEHMRAALIKGTRREQLRDLTKMSDAQIDARLADLFPERVKAKVSV